MQHKISKKETKLNVTGIGIGVAISMMISLLGAGVGALMILNEMIGQAVMPVAAGAVQFLSVFIGGVVSCKKVGEKYILASGITVLIYLFLLMSAMALLFDGDFNHLWSCLLVSALGAALACTTCLMKSQHKTHRKRAHC